MHYLGRPVTSVYARIILASFRLESSAPYFASDPPNAAPIGSPFLFDWKALRYFLKDGHHCKVEGWLLRHWSWMISWVLPLPWLLFEFGCWFGCLWLSWYTLISLRTHFLVGTELNPCGYWATMRNSHILIWQRLGCCSSCFRQRKSLSQLRLGIDDAVAVAVILNVILVILHP